MSEAHKAAWALAHIKVNSIKRLEYALDEACCYSAYCVPEIEKINNVLEIIASIEATAREALKLVKEDK